MNWDKIKIIKSDGEIVDAQAPIIISVSRSTDIPAFYSNWFIERLKAGYLRWKNPFNGVPIYVTFENARLFVFWSKNPKPLMKQLYYLDEKNFNYYFQYTLNDYDKDGLEPNVPNVQSRIDTFQELSERVGKKKVIWRFDPLILTDKIGVQELLKKIEGVGNQLKLHTEKMVFSFADINTYKKVQTNLKRGDIDYQEFKEKDMIELANGLQQLNKTWNLKISTCAEKISLEQYGISHNKCVDDDLMIELFPEDKILMNFLGVKISPPDMFNPDGSIQKVKNLKDKGQRKFCGCVFSKDIGEYNTCPHLCEYCYANVSKEIAIRNWNLHKQNSNNDSIM